MFHGLLSAERYGCAASVSWYVHQPIVRLHAVLSAENCVNAVKNDIDIAPGQLSCTLG